MLSNILFIKITITTIIQKTIIFQVFSKKSQVNQKSKDKL